MKKQSPKAFRQTDILSLITEVFSASDEYSNNGLFIWPSTI